MTPEHRVIIDKQCKLAEAGDENAIKFLRAFIAGLSQTAPVSALSRVVERFNDAYVDEIIEWAVANRTEVE